MPNLAIVPFDLPAAPDRPLRQLKRSRKPATAVADSAIVPFEDPDAPVPPVRQHKRKRKAGAGAGDSLTIVPFEDPAASDRPSRQLKRNRKSSGGADSFAIVPFEEPPAPVCIWSSRLRFPRITHLEHKRDRRASPGKSLAAQVAAWVEARVAAGVPEEECKLPFLTHAPKMVACGLCRRCVYSHDRLKCSVAACRWVFHSSCAKNRFGFYSKRFKCPQHACFLCKTNYNWRCVRCTVASHTKCAPWPDEVFYLTKPGRAAGQAVCWRHSTDWRHEEHSVPTSDVEEAFSRLALPYVDEEFTIDSILKDVMENTSEPAPYVHIKRNLYLMKKKRDCDQSDVGCTNCNSNSTCSEECECRGLSISCSRACHCSDKCRNRPFRKEKKLKVVKTMSCGWGVEALETLKKGDFVVEYIGEVIDDALCEQRLWDMKRRGDQNFYMCEVQKDFTIDATFKGNSSRFLNHSCDPNCKLEKWQVDGETRVGVFALRSIEAGEPLTYDYRFENFGPIDKCHCGATSCQGLFGSKKKNTSKLQESWEKFSKAIEESPEKDSKWGQKRSRTTSRVWKCR